MPIYAYRCTSCGHAKDVLQKVSDPLLSECPACGAATFIKQVTAAGFQLKGSGWYVTDFRGGSNNGAARPDGEAGEKTAEAGGTDKPAEKTERAAETPAQNKAADKAAAPAPATPAAAPAAPAKAAKAAPAAPAAPTASPPASGS